MANLDERWPSLVLDPEDSDKLPAQLVRKLQKANDDLDAAELAIAKYDKYAGLGILTEVDQDLLLETRTPDE